MTDKECIEEIKEIIRENYKKAREGIFNNQNLVGSFAEEYLTRLYTKNRFAVDICYWGYFEVFGCTDEEFEELREFYKTLEQN